jgi:hypothetical protein
MIGNIAVFVSVKHAIPSKMTRSTRVTKRVGCDRNGTSHVRVESLDEVNINYITQPHR